MVQRLAAFQSVPQVGVAASTRLHRSQSVTDSRQIVAKQLDISAYTKQQQDGL